MRNILIAALLLFFATATQAQELDRSQKPAPGPAPKIQLGDVASFTLDNGLKVFVVENKSAPSINASLLIDRSPILEGDKAGLTDLFGEVLGSGTKTKSKDEFNEAIDFIGGSLSTSSTGVYLSSLQKHFPTMMELAADAILNPVFKEEELEKARTQAISGLQAAKSDPSTISSRVFNRIIFGDGHPYAETETEETLKNISIEDLEDYYNTHFIPNQAYLAIVGNISKKDAKKLVEKHLKSWEKGEVKEASFPEPKISDKSFVAVVDRPNAVQSTIRIGHIADIKVGAEDAIPATVMNTMLGGGAFRLFDNLREKNAFTYGAYSSLSADKYMGYFAASTEVRNEVTDSAVREFYNEFHRIRDEKPEDKELQTVKNYRSGNFAISLENARTVANFAINIDRYGLPEDYYENYLKKVEQVTPEQINEMAKKYIHPDKAVILVVGNASEVAPKLQEFGDIRFFDIYGNETEATLSEPIPEGMTVQKVIDGYFEAIGGKKEAGRVKTMRQVSTANIQGNEIKLTSYQRPEGGFLFFRKSDAYRAKISVGTQVVQNIIFDGEKGIQKGMMGEQKMEGAQLQSMRIQARPFHLLDIDDLNIKAELTSIEHINDTRAYKLKLQYKDHEWTEYFDVESMLKVAAVDKMEGQDGKTVVQTTYYDEYSEIDGLLIPNRISQDIDGQMIDFNVNQTTINGKLDKSLFEIEK